MAFFETHGFEFTQEQMQINQKTIEILAACIFARRDEIQKILTQIVLESSSDKFLIDYNYNIEFVMSSSSAAKIGQPIMVLELFLRVNEDEQTG